MAGVIARNGVSRKDVPKQEFGNEGRRDAPKQKFGNDTKRRYSRAEFARRRDTLIESKVRPILTAADEDKFVAGDIETGEYELDNRETDDR